MSGPVLPAPYCAVCRREVAEMTVAHWPHKHQLEVTVSCHGSTQTEFISYAQLATLDFGAPIEPGVAFENEVQQRMIEQSGARLGAAEKYPWESTEEYQNRTRAMLDLPAR